MSQCWTLACVVLAGSLAAGCSGPQEVSFTGRMHVESGRCSIEDMPVDGLAASLGVRGRSVVFAPDAGVVTLPGSIDAAGHVVAGAMVTGADRKPFVMSFEGDLRTGVIEGRYATPRCRAVVRLVQAG